MSALPPKADIGKRIDLHRHCRGTTDRLETRRGLCSGVVAVVGNARNPRRPSDLVRCFVERPSRLNLVRRSVRGRRRPNPVGGLERIIFAQTICEDGAR